MSAAYGELRGRSALVTGGTSGIGRACVERLRGEGMTVSFTGRDAGRAARVEEQTGASFLPADARDRLAVADAVAEAAARAGGRLDVVVANAGILFGGPLEQTPPEVFDELVAVNLTAVFATARAAFPTMRAQGRGSLVLIASDAGIRGVHELPAYSATKAGVVALSELLAAEGAPHGVRANAVCPGDVTPGVQATPAGHPEHAEDPARWTLPPSGRFGTGEDVAALVAWLASDESSHVTGATVRIDGGTGAALRASTRGSHG